MPDPLPRVDEIAPYLPEDLPYATLAVELALKRWEVIQLRALLAAKQTEPPQESGDT